MLELPAEVVDAWRHGQGFIGDIHSRAALFRSIRTEITRLCQEAKTRPVLVIDEAHNLRSDVLEDLAPS